MVSGYEEREGVGRKEGETRSLLSQSPGGAAPGVEDDGAFLDGLHFGSETAAAPPREITVYRVSALALFYALWSG